jgi:hypothetical protein
MTGERLASFDRWRSAGTEAIMPLRADLIDDATRQLSLDTAGGDFYELKLQARTAAVEDKNSHGRLCTHSTT